MSPTVPYTLLIAKTRSSVAIFPGYYTGCALHIYTKVFTEWTPLPNGSFEAGRLSHTGQFFFDDDLVETTSKVRDYVPSSFCLPCFESLADVHLQMWP